MGSEKGLVFPIGQVESWKEGHVIIPFRGVGIVKAVPYDSYNDNFAVSCCEIADIIILKVLQNVRKNN